MNSTMQQDVVGESKAIKEENLPASLAENMYPYYNYTRSPLGQLFYKTIFKQLETVQGKTVLDFGSGFGYTANFLAKNNRLTAVEVSPSIIEACENTENFEQLQGSFALLEQMENERFDFITCHLVLEYMDEPKALLTQLCRVLKNDGTLSLVRHNRAGRIVQAVAQEYDLAEASRLLQGENSHSSAFGDIRYYTNEDVLAWSGNSLRMEKLFGVRALASLHDRHRMSEKSWIEEMLAMEEKLLERPEFVDISYFHHLLFKKTLSETRF